METTTTTRITFTHSDGYEYMIEAHSQRSWEIFEKGSDEPLTVAEVSDQLRIRAQEIINKAFRTTLSSAVEYEATEIDHGRASELLRKINAASARHMKQHNRVKRVVDSIPHFSHIPDILESYAEADYENTLYRQLDRSYGEYETDQEWLKGMLEKVCREMARYNPTNGRPIQRAINQIEFTVLGKFYQDLTLFIASTFPRGL